LLYVQAIERSAREQRPAPPRRHRGWLWAVVTVLAGAVLLFCYLRIAGGTEVNADADGLVLQASDMLHGNWLLHNWWDTDVSFITTELPEYMLVTKVAGLRPEIVHISAALTYTALVLLAAFVARGRARGAEGVVRALIAAGIMLAPQPTWTTPVLLGSPDHVGTAVPLLLLLLLLDRAPPRRARAYWFFPACIGVCILTTALLAAVIVGDALAEVVGVVPLIIACLLGAVRISLVRAVRALLAWRARARGDGERAPAAAVSATEYGGSAAGYGASVNEYGASANGYETSATEYGAVTGEAVVPAAVSSTADDTTAEDERRVAAASAVSDTSWRTVFFLVLLAASAAAALPVASYANKWIIRHGGYHLGPERYGQLPWHAIVKNAPVVWQSFLALFGADYVGVKDGWVGFAFVHFIGVAIVIAGIVFAVWRLVVPGRRARAGDLIADFLVIAVLVNIAAYFAFVLPVNIYSAHEIGPVAAFGAALAGRMLGGPLLRLRRAPRQSAEEPGDRPSSRLPWAGRDRRRGFPVLVPVLAAWLACYAVLLGVAAAIPQGAPQDSTLAVWLDRHHLYNGLASYWEASSVTVNSNGKVTMLAVGIHGWNRRLAADKWETDLRLNNAAAFRADFIVVGPDRIVPSKLAIMQFGKPVQTYHYGPYTIMVWNKNLVGELNKI
jgi:hypothetical protein